MGRRRRWHGAVAAATLLAVVAVWDGNGTLVLAAAIPVAFLAYGSLSTVSSPDGVVAHRRVDPSPAPPGRPVDVTVTITNESADTLDDVRVLDSVPAELAVVGGSPRAGTTLGPGESTTIEYTLVARRGEYDLPPPRFRVRGAGAGAVATARPDTNGDDRLICRLDADAPPLSDQGSQRVGQLTADEPGDGLSFHSTREYRRGDPASRIDWRHYAKEGQLSTVNYERWVSTTVVVVLDAREPARVASGPGRPTAVELGAYAATRALTSLLRSGHDVAIAVVGVDGDGPEGLAWLPPGGGSEQRSRAVGLLGDAVDETGMDGDADGGDETGAAADAGDGGGEPGTAADADGAAEAAAVQFRKVAELAGPGSQLMLVSPFLDQAPVDAVESWAAFDVPRIVLSPDVVPENTVSGRFEGIRRHTRLARCQASGARTVDWRRGTPLQIVLSLAFAAAARESSASAMAGGGV